MLYPNSLVTDWSRLVLQQEQHKFRRQFYLERLEYWERFLKSKAVGCGSIWTVFSSNNNNKIEIPGGNWREIFSPLAVRLKCTRVIKWKPEVKTLTTSSVAWVNKELVLQDSWTSLGSKNVLLNWQPLQKNSVMVTKHREICQQARLE